MDPLIAILVVAYIILGFGIAYSTSVEITIDGPVTMFLIIRALLSLAACSSARRAPRS